VIYSDWLQIKFVDFKAQLDAPKLTDQIHEQGEVVVFFATNTAPGASAYRLNYYANPLTWVSFYITVGKINFIAGDTYNTHTYYVRYILIPGGVHARRGSGDRPG